MESFHLVGLLASLDSAKSVLCTSLSTLLVFLTTLQKTQRTFVLSIQLAASFDMTLTNSPDKAFTRADSLVASALYSHTSLASSLFHLLTDSTLT